MEEPLLPERKVEYAPPRPLVAAQKGALEPPEPMTIEVAGNAGPSANVQESPVETEAPYAEDRASTATLDTLPPRARHSSRARARAIVIAVVASAAAVTVYAAVRSAAVKHGKAEAARAEEPAPTPSAVTGTSPPLPEPPADIATATAVVPEPRVAEVEKTAEIASAEREPAPLRPTRPLATSKRGKPPAPTSNVQPTEAPRTSPPRGASGGAIVRESPF